MAIIISDIEQGSPEWFALKAGSVGASNIDKIVTVDGKPSKQRTEFMYQLAGERITGRCEETFQSLAMQNGIEREASARVLFEMVIGVDVQQVGIVFADESRTVHCSPDGLIGDDEGVEIKNPMMKTHVKYMLNGKLPTEYFSQIQMSLYVTGRKRWWFMSCYDGLKPLIIECKRDDFFLECLDRELRAFNADLEKIVKEIS
jgi:putative phage-type endonuclease